MQEEGGGCSAGHGWFRGQGQFQGKGSGMAPGGQIKFQGACKGLKGHVYNCLTNGVRMVDLYTKMTQAIAIYMGSTCKSGMDVHSAIKNLKRPTISLLPNPSIKATAGEKLEWQERIKEIAKQKNLLEENVGKLFSVLIRQHEGAAEAQSPVCRSGREAGWSRASGDAPQGML